jgi:hypothetical protein
LIQTSEDLSHWNTLTPLQNNATQISAKLPNNGVKLFGRLRVDYNP